ncbi:class A basic helix-loop-helix protein 15-like [Lethenteron reissneri]|uniref:class A basic helix-loop-helix protein 15-like n=1 Tax=Lethenteron reissneri TaxID=7753 RepID=UPI002AB61A2F|nr:class A basic helix-loop-helix protein 15-like [Lethenteron reissneri]XP_061416875.1 class A basic helix-loop-helix protein 15-like [Lethenteron reissneri]
MPLRSSTRGRGPPSCDPVPPDQFEALCSSDGSEDLRPAMKRRRRRRKRRPAMAAVATDTEPVVKRPQRRGGDGVGDEPPAVGSRSRSGSPSGSGSGDSASRGDARDERTLRRLESNERERQRMHGLNDAFQGLREAIPHVRRGRKLSKLETLTLAKNYIEALTGVIGHLADGERRLEQLVQQQQQQDQQEEQEEQRGAEGDPVTSVPVRGVPVNGFPVNGVSGRGIPVREVPVSGHFRRKQQRRSCVGK